jgi:GntR family transcriptional repressor for pyruvate dehydrogenase complex
MSSFPVVFWKQLNTIRWDSDMSAVKKVRLCESVIDAIKKMIAVDGFNPGDKFYSEKELTTRLQVSRSSIREALRILEVTGQVNVKQGKGIFISDIQGRRFKEFSTWLKIHEQSIKDNFEVRLIIEPKAARNAAEKATPGDIKNMESACTGFAQFVKDSNTEEAIVCDHRFHSALAGATKNKTLYVLMKAMITTLSDGWVSSLYTPGRTEQTIYEHGDIVDAIKNHDRAGAENAMTRHLVNALHDITKHMNKGKP